MKTVIHVLGNNTWKPEFEFLGSTKDIVGRREYFDARGIECREFIVRNRSDAICLDLLRRANLSDVDAVLVEHPRYPKSLAYLKAEHPRIARIIRGHNAELIHQFHTALAFLRCRLVPRARRRRQALTAVRSAFQRFRYDLASARLADHVLAISEWEAERYWGRLTARDKVVWCPYFVPDRYAASPPPGPIGESDTRFLCLAVTSADWTPLAHEAAQILVDLVGRMPPEAVDDWAFAIGGQLGPRGGAESLYPGDRIARLGVVENPIALMTRARALAHLSSLGMGFKTKLLDFVLASGGWLLVPGKLQERLPPALHPFCIAVDASSVQSLEVALKQAGASLPGRHDVNNQLKQGAFAALDRVFGRAEA